MTPTALTQFSDNLVEVPALNAAVQDLGAAECGGESFQEPENLLDSLPPVAFTERAFRRLEGLVDQRLRLRIERGAWSGTGIGM